MVQKLTFKYTTFIILTDTKITPSLMTLFSYKEQQSSIKPLQALSKLSQIQFVLLSDAKQDTQILTLKRVGLKLDTIRQTLLLRKRSNTPWHLTNKQLLKLVIIGLLLMMVNSFNIIQAFDQILTALQWAVKMASAPSQKIMRRGRKSGTPHLTLLSKRVFSNQMLQTNKLKKCLERPGLDYI